MRTDGVRASKWGGGQVGRGGGVLDLATRQNDVIVEFGLPCEQRRQAVACKFRAEYVLYKPDTVLAVMKTRHRRENVCDEACC